MSGLRKSVVPVLMKSRDSSQRESRVGVVLDANLRPYSQQRLAKFVPALSIAGEHKGDVYGAVDAIMLEFRILVKVVINSAKVWPL